MKKISLLLLLTLLGCSLLDRSDHKTFTILHTNDHHGHYLADDKGQYGMAARSTLLKKLRKQLDNKKTPHLLLSGGDINTGTLESDLFDAKPDFIGMKKLKYDAMAVGNHEFDNSFQVIQEQQKWAGFPFLSANIYHKNTGKRAFTPFIIKNVKGIKVAIFGLTVVDTPDKASHTDAKKMFEFRNIISEAKIVLTEIASEKPDLVIAVTHVGHRGSGSINGDVELAKNVDGIDVIVGGHSQEVINAEEHNNTIIVQAEDWGKYLGKLDIELQNDKVKKLSYVLIPVNLKKKDEAGEYQYIGEEIAQDQEFVQFFKPFESQAEKLASVTVGSLDKTLDGSRTQVRTKQMPIAQFVGAAMRSKVNTIEVGVLNGGSLRESLPAGKINRKKLHSLHPYGNTIVSVKLTAKEFYDYMQQLVPIIYQSQEQPVGGYPQLIGFKMTIGKDKKIESISDRSGKWKITRTLDGKVASNKKNFVLGTMNFLARGGDHYPVITENETYMDSGFMINSAMMDYVANKKKINKKDYSVDSNKVIIFKK